MKVCECPHTDKDVYIPRLLPHHRQLYLLLQSVVFMNPLATQLLPMIQLAQNLKSGKLLSNAGRLAQLIGTYTLDRQPPDKVKIQCLIRNGLRMLYRHDLPPEP
jgi:hypothetical protein